MGNQVFIILIKGPNKVSALVSLIIVYILMNYLNILISLSTLVFSCYHNKLSDLKQQKFILCSRGQKPKASMLEGPHSRLWESICPLPPPAYGGCWHSWTCGCIAPICLCHNASTSVSNPSLPFSYKRYLSLDLATHLPR